MPRKARVVSSTGFLHVIVRGIGRQFLFEDQEDYTFYLQILEKYCQETRVLVCSYCLMENHVHLLIQDPDNNISLFMKKMGVSYSKYFNKKYERVGHLFQDRYLSEPVETIPYLKKVFRYILRNPQKAGICQVQEFQWSSYYAYNNYESFVDTSLLEELIGSWDEYERFISNENDERCMEFETAAQNDKKALEIISMHLRGKSGTALQDYPRPERNAILKKLRAAGLTAPQLERLTGISRGIVYRVCRKTRS